MKPQNIETSSYMIAVLGVRRQCERDSVVYEKWDNLGLELQVERVRIHFLKLL